MYLEYVPTLLNLFQSAYTKFYSTETTQLSLHDHLSNAISMQKSPAFVFLIYLLPLILSTTLSYFIVYPPDSAFPLFTTMVHFISLIPHSIVGILPHFDTSPSSPLTYEVPQGSRSHFFFQSLYHSC